MRSIKPIYLLLALCLSTKLCLSEGPEPEAPAPAPQPAAPAPLENSTKSVTDLTTTLKTDLAKLEGQITAQANPVKKAAYREGQAALITLSAITSALQKDLGEITKILTPETNVDDELKKLDDWHSDQLKKVDKATDGFGVRDAQAVLRDVTFRFNNNLKSCTSVADSQQKTYEVQVRIFVNRNTANSKRLTDEITSCDNPNASNNRCRINIVNLSATVSNAPNDLKFVRRAGKELTDTAKYGNGCVKYFVEELKKLQAKAERAIKDIIEIYPSATEAVPET